MNEKYYSEGKTHPLQVSAIPVQAAIPVPHIQPPLKWFRKKH